MSSIPPKVFISATSGDLRSIRQMVRDALLDMGCMPVVQEHFGPDYRDVSGMLGAKVAECDALIHIAGMRYGAEPDPETLPPGTPRRSYTQMEVDLARKLKLEKVFTFVCPKDFPYDTADAKGEPLREEPEDLRKWQEKHRERLLAQKELRYQPRNSEELAIQVREIQLELQQVKGKLAGTRKKMLKVGGAIVVALTIIAGGILWQIEGQREQGDDLSAIREQFDNNPGIVAEQLKTYVRLNADKKIAELAGQWDRIAEIEDSRDRQLQEIDELVDFIREGLSGDADPIFVRASAILADQDPTTGGPANALAYLQASRSRILAKVDRLAGDEEDARNRKQEALRPILLEAEIHEKAFEWDEALADRRLVVENAPYWWKALNGLGNLCMERALWEEADTYLRRALELADEDQKPTSWNNLALLLKSQGAYEQAEPLYREALETSERLLGREHPDTLTSMNNLALLLESKGAYEEAELLSREALETSEQVLGREHPYTLSSMNNLALLLESKGAYEEAEPLYREALETRERVLGREHPDTLTSINNLAELLRKKGAYEEAEPLSREALETSERVLGRKHPDTLTSINNLALLLKSKGAYEEAEPLYREALEIEERVLGREHPYTLSSVNNLAGLLYSQGNYEEAEPLYREAYEGFVKMLGENHPTTKIVEENRERCREDLQAQKDTTKTSK